MTADLEEDSLFDPRSLSVKELLIRLDGKVTSGLGILTEGQVSLRSTTEDHEARIRLLEARPTVSPKALFAGIATLVGMVAGLATTVIAIVSHVHIS